METFRINKLKWIKIIFAINLDKMHNFKNLIVWKKSIQLGVKIYNFSKTFSLKDQYIFSSQLSRCVFSIPSNIAEGSGKDSIKDFCRYLNISAGSSFELETQLIILKEIQENKKIEIDILIKEVVEIQKMIYGFKKQLLEK